MSTTTETRREATQRDPMLEMAYWRTVYQLRDEGWSFEDALTETQAAVDRLEDNTRCEDCGKPLEPDNKTGICTGCIFGRL